MVINPEATGAFALGGRGEIADVTEIIVRPDDRDIVRYTQALTVEIEDFLVGAEHLGDSLHLGADMFREQRSLVGEDLPQHVDAFVIALGSLNGAVMYAAHAERVDGFVAAVGPHAFFPVGTDPFAIADVVVVGFGRGPFADVVAEHRLGVRRAHDDAVIVGEHGVAWISVEGFGAGVHRRPEGVGLEAQQELEDFCVGLGADAAVFRFEGFRGPRLQAPILVIDEDAAILHRWRAEAFQTRRNQQRGFLFGRDVGPPMPGRNTDLLGKFIDAECGAAAVAADDDERLRHTGERFFHDGDDETLPRSGQRSDIDFLFCGETVDHRMFAQGADENQCSAFGEGRDGHGRLCPGDAFDVGRELAGGDGNHFIVSG